jgi:hypothetical protein
LYKTLEFVANYKKSELAFKLKILQNFLKGYLVGKHIQSDKEKATLLKNLAIRFEKSSSQYLYRIPGDDDFSYQADICLIPIPPSEISFLKKWPLSFWRKNRILDIEVEEMEDDRISRLFF